MSFASSLASALLHTRALARAPLWLWRARLGMLLGPRLVVVEHRGRSSGHIRQVVLEVVDRPGPDVIRVVSGFGPRSQWYRNLLVDPQCRVSSGHQQRVSATAEPLPQNEVPAALDRYRGENPKAWRTLEQVIGEHLPDGMSYGEFLPMMDLRLDISSLPPSGVH